MMGIAPPPESGMNEFGKLVEFLADKEALKARLAEYKEAHAQYSKEFSDISAEVAKLSALEKSLIELKEGTDKALESISMREAVLVPAEASIAGRESEYGAKVSSLESSYREKHMALEARRGDLDARDNNLSKIESELKSGIEKNAAEKARLSKILEKMKALQLELNEGA